MKPKLTIAVRRGLKRIATLAEADFDADQSNDSPDIKGKERSDFLSALKWIASLDANKEVK